MKSVNYSIKAIALFLFLLCASLAGNAQDSFCYKGVYYLVTDYNTVAVTSSPDNSYSGTIEIPSTVYMTIYFYGEEYQRDYTVTAIGEGAFRECFDLQQVILPNTITTIDKNAFYNCTNLSSIVFPSSLSKINQSAFAYCTSLTSVVIPDNVVDIGWNVFYGCTGLTSVTISKYVSQLNGTFQGCVRLTSVVIPESVTCLDGTFKGCMSLGSVDILGPLEYIGPSTFEECYSLTSIILPESLTYIDDKAFLYCLLQTIVCKPTTPPEMFPYTLDSFSSVVYDNCLLYVPNRAIYSYRTTDWWRMFKNILGFITLNESSITLNPRQTYRLTAQLAPGLEDEAGVVWQSDNTNIVTVTADGLVKAISHGVAFVSASYYGEEAICEVIVMENPMVGDVNGDGEVNIADINALIDAILGGNIKPNDIGLYDTNVDGEVNIADINALIDLILNG